MSGQATRRSVRNFLQEYSIPLIGGVVAAVVAANTLGDGYHHFLDAEIPFLGVSLHFLINDIFMVLFFGIAAKEITESCLPGGALNPPGKAVNPLLGCAGGVVGPIAVFLGLVYMTGNAEQYARGWGIPTATDIALAWLVARMVFGAGHPAVNFLLLLAVADDAIGLGIIAIFYPDPAHPVNPAWLGLTAGAMAVAYALRRFQVQQWQAYLLIPGVMSWVGLHSAHLHPALSLVFVVPFMPAAKRDEGLFAESEDQHEAHGSTLERFEHSLKSTVDFGLFFFAYANAGVAFSHIGPGTWYVLAALLVGKTVGITGFSMLAVRMGFPLPEGMGVRHLVVAGVVAGVGLTVALFVAGEAYTGVAGEEAKMGALFSAGVALVAFALGRALNVKDRVSSPVAADLALQSALAEAHAAAAVGAQRARAGAHDEATEAETEAQSERNHMEV